MLFLANIAGWVVAHWRIVVYAALALVVLISGVMLFRSCGKKTPKLDQAEIIKAQQAIAANDRKIMVETIANSDAREAAIDQNLANAKQVTMETVANSKAEWANKTNEELAAELERRSHE